MQEYWVLGDKIAGMTTQDLFDEIEEIISQKKSEIILNNNIHGVHLGNRMPWLREFRNGARIVHCDGAGLVLGARLLGQRAPARVSLNDCFWDFAGLCARKGYSLYLLGGSPQVIARTTAAVRAREPRLRIAGARHGYFAKTGPESEAVIQDINRERPNVLMVGFGMPLQERWLRDHGDRIDANVKWAVGGLFDRVSGEVPLSPPWINDNGLEWLYLSLKQPRRFFKRYLVENPRFLLDVLVERYLSGRRPMAGSLPSGRSKGE